MGRNVEPIIVVQRRFSAIVIGGVWIGFPIAYSGVAIAGIYRFAVRAREVRSRRQPGVGA